MPAWHQQKVVVGVVFIRETEKSIPWHFCPCCPRLDNKRLLSQLNSLGRQRGHPERACACASLLLNVGHRHNSDSGAYCKVGHDVKTVEFWVLAQYARVGRHCHPDAEPSNDTHGKQDDWKTRLALKAAAYHLLEAVKVFGLECKRACHDLTDFGAAGC